MKLEFISKNPHSTRSLVISYSTSEDIQPLIDDLAKIGWTKNPCAPPCQGSHEVSFSKSGTGIFRSWTADEKKNFLKEVERTLKTHGHKNVPYRKLTFAECL